MSIRSMVLGKYGDCVVMGLLIFLCMAIPEVLIRGTLFITLMSPVLFAGIMVERIITKRDIDEDYVRMGIVRLIILVLFIGMMTAPIR